MAQFVILSAVSNANAIEESRTAWRALVRRSAPTQAKPVPVLLVLSAAGGAMQCSAFVNVSAGQHTSAAFHY